MMLHLYFNDDQQQAAGGTAIKWRCGERGRGREKIFPLFYAIT
jgi:hypothetical protein